MHSIRRWLGGALLLGSAIAVASPSPNFLIIVADDLGFSDLGAFGSEIETPVLDSLANAGLKFTNFHAAPTCSPTRAMLLTGLDNHAAGLGAMAEARAPNQQGQPGYEGHLRTDNATIAELLSASGYRTHFAGKWHLGMQPEQAPHRRGFETSFVLLQGMHNHFGHDLSGAAVGHPPTYLANGEPVEQLPEDFYSSDYFTARLIEQLRAARQGAGRDKPFFAWLAYTAPHWPIHAPQEVVDRFRGRYAAGYEALREQRLQRMIELGLVEPDTVPADFDLAPRWEQLLPAEQARMARRMEVYAAMIARLDENVGRVIGTLRETRELENTYIIFLSDNGAEAADVTDLPPQAVAFLGIANADNRLETIGRPTSFDSVGPGWAEATNVPLRRVKAYQAEGGSRVAAFLTGPGIRSGIAREFVSVTDVAPTLLDLASVDPPGERFEGRSIRPMHGRSWLAWLRGEAGSVYGADDAFAAELFGGRAVWQGDWKLLDEGDGQWRLFNLARDPGETRDRSATEPVRRQAMIDAWQVYADEHGVVLPAQPMPILTRPSLRRP